MTQPTPTLLELLEDEAAQHDYHLRTLQNEASRAALELYGPKHRERAQLLRAASQRLRIKVAAAEAIGRALEAREYVSPLDVARRELTIEINGAGPMPAHAATTSCRNIGGRCRPDECKCPGVLASAPTCAEWCGDVYTAMAAKGRQVGTNLVGRVYHMFCSQACTDAAKPLNPVPR